MSSQASDVGRHLVTLMRLMGKVKAQAAASELKGLEWSAYVLLFHLITDGPQRSKALAERLHADPSTVSRQAAALVDLGLVERTPDPGDGRAALLGASPAGHQLFEGMQARRDTLFRAVLADWADDDANDFTRLLRRFNTDFEKHITASTPAARIDDPQLQESS